MKYAIIDSHMGSCWIDKYDTKEEAIRQADWEWLNKSRSEKKYIDEFLVVGYEDEEKFDECEEYQEIVKDYK